MWFRESTGAKMPARRGTKEWRPPRTARTRRPGRGGCTAGRLHDPAAARPGPRGVAWGPAPHRRLPAGARARRRGPPQAGRAVQGLPDAPQPGTLPGLGPSESIRLVPLGRTSAPCGWEGLKLLQSSCMGRPTRRCPIGQPRSRAGASRSRRWPSACCRACCRGSPRGRCQCASPPFPVRAALYRRAHKLLTDGSGQGL